VIAQANPDEHIGAQAIAINDQRLQIDALCWLLHEVCPCRIFLQCMRVEPLPRMHGAAASVHAGGMPRMDGAAASVHAGGMPRMHGDSKCACRRQQPGISPTHV
jgi:hypothetical protein